MSWKATNIEPFDWFDQKITVEIRTLWFKPRVAQFVGSGAFWRQFPSGRKCSTATDLWLANSAAHFRFNPPPAQAGGVPPINEAQP